MTELRPSAAHRWLLCPASVIYKQSEQMSPYAAEGVEAHDKAARILHGETLEGVDTHVLTYVDFVRHIAVEEFVLPSVEQSVDISVVTGEPGATGTPDAVVYGDKTLHVIDLKYGRGVRVRAADNDQLMIYAAACLGDHDMVELHIHQPRNGGVNSALYPAESVHEFAANVKAAARRPLELIKSPGIISASDYKASEKACRWCPARGGCAARAEMEGHDVLDYFENYNEAMAMIVDDATLVDLAKKLKRVESYKEDIWNELLSRLLTGNDIPGVKLADGRRGSREWLPEVVESPYITDIKTALISPTELERKNPKLYSEVAAYVIQKEGKPTVKILD